MLNKKIIILVLAFMCLFVFSSCNGENDKEIRCLEIYNSTPLYSDREIESAMDTVKKQFVVDFPGSVLDRLVLKDDLNDNENNIVITATITQMNESADYLCHLKKSETGEWTFEKWN